MQNKIIVKEIRKLSNLNPFVNIVYNNFISIANISNLKHNKIEIKNLLSKNNFIGLFAFLNDKLIAYIIGETKHLNDGRIVYYITYFFVAAKYRNKGIGTNLMDILINKCKIWEIKYITLTFNVKNKKILHFYKKKGFIFDPILKNNSQYDVLTLYV